MSRVQVQDLPNPERFRATQPTGDTFGGAERPVIDQNAERLASALSAFGASVTTAASRSANDKARGEHLLAEYENLRQRAQGGDVEAGRAVMSGAIPVLAHPRAGPIAADTLGRDHARVWVEQQRREIAAGTYPLFNSEGRPEDINAIHAQRVGAHYQRQPPQFQLSPDRVNMVATAYQRGFAAEVGKAREEAIAAQRAAVGAESNIHIGNSITRLLSPVGEAAARVGPDGRPAVSDEQLADLWRRQREEVRSFFTPVGQDPNRETRISYQRMDERMLGWLNDAATRNPEAVVRILNLDRGTTPDGTALGSLAQTRPDRAREIFDRANTELASRWDTARREHATGQAVTALRAGDGSFQAIAPVVERNPFRRSDAAPLTISAEEQQQAAVQRHEAATADQLRREGASDTASQDTLWRVGRTTYIQNNVVNRQWRDTLNVYGRVMSNAVDVSSPEGAKSVVAAVDLYERLHRTNPGYTEQTLGVSQDAQRFYNLVRTFRDLRGIDPENAVRMAATRMRSAAATPGRDERDAISSEARSIGTTMFGWMGGGVNRRAAERAIEDVAGTLLGGDIDPKTAVASAARIVNERAAVVNGHLVLGSTYIRRDNQAVVERRLGEIQTQFAGRLTGDGGIYSGRLAIVPDSNRTSFTVIQAEGNFRGEPLATMAPVTDREGRPVLGADGKPQYRPQLLRIVGTEIQQMERADAAAREAAKAAAETQRQHLERDRAIANGPTSGMMSRTLPPGVTGGEMVREAQQDAARRLAGRRAPAELRDEDPAQRGEVIGRVPEADRGAARERLAEERQRRGREAEADDPAFIRRIRGERRPAANPAIEQDQQAPAQGDPLAPVKGIAEWLRRNGGAQRRTD